jgi:hypothetical protein
MGLLSWLDKKYFGEVIADYGGLPTDQLGWRVSVTLRQIKGKQPHLLLKWKKGGYGILTSLQCTPETFEKLDHIIRDSREKVSKSVD